MIHEEQLSRLALVLTGWQKVRTRKNAGLAILTISTLEYQKLVGHLIFKVVPPLCLAVVDLYVLTVAPGVDEIAGHGVFIKIHSGSVTNGQRPVDTRPSDWVPDTYVS